MSRTIKAFIGGAVLGIVMSLCYMTMGGPTFLGLPIEVVFFPGAIVDWMLSRLFQLDESHLLFVMSLFIVANAIGYGIVAAIVTKIACTLGKA